MKTIIIKYNEKANGFTYLEENAKGKFSGFCFVPMVRIEKVKSDIETYISKGYNVEIDDTSGLISKPQAI